MSSVAAPVYLQKYGNEMIFLKMINQSLIKFHNCEFYTTYHFIDKQLILLRHQSRSQSFVPLDQRSENVSSGSNHYERTKEITEFWLSGSLRICIYGACLKWLLPELSFSDRWSRGTKLWERDCFVIGQCR